MDKKTVSSILRKELNILGTWNSEYRGRKPSDWTEGLALLESGLPFADLISRRIGLSELPQALGDLYAHKARRERHELLKVMVCGSA
jgi:threonine dehydrogenase-like Zn-dependent dehydrogenase